MTLYLRGHSEIFTYLHKHLTEITNERELFKFFFQRDYFVSIWCMDVISRPIFNLLTGQNGLYKMAIAQSF